MYVVSTHWNRLIEAILVSTFNIPLSYRRNNITAKANSTLCFVKRNFKTQNEPMEEVAYNTLLRPQVEYASQVWSPHIKQNIHKLEMIQIRAARWANNNHSQHESVHSVLDDLGWRSLENRRTDTRLIMFH